MREVWQIVKSHTFITLSLLGNLLICFVSVVFYLLEKDINPNLVTFIDALWWGFATATTTGYGDITPVTVLGKFISIFLMLTGLALFGMFTALFAEVVLVKSKRSNEPLP